MIKTDVQAYAAYTSDRHLYNKLYLAGIEGAVCGTGHIPYDGLWIVRPIINLEGMGIDANIGHLCQGDLVPDGMFYCEVFTGRHITIDYVREEGKWFQSHTFQGFNTPDNLIQFSKWVRIEYPFPIPRWLKRVEANHINIEMIGDKVIEAHLRPNPDPVMYDEFWPIWSNNQLPPGDRYVKIPDKEDHIGRLGFYVYK